MDAASTQTISAAKTISLLAAPINRKVTNLTSKWPQKNLKLFYLHDLNKKIAPFLTHCSTKPNTDKNSSATNENETVDSSRGAIQEQPKPRSSQALSSSDLLCSRGLVFDLGHKDSWDSVEIGSPVVKRFLSDEEERWYMWYHGRSSGNPGADSIGLAVSSNGVHWERGGGGVKSSGDVGMVMRSGQDWWAFDTEGIRPCEVVIMSSSKIRTNSAVYWLYYTGFGSEKIESLDNTPEFGLRNPERVRTDTDESVDTRKIFKSLPGLAMSQDGRHWARIEGEHHSGALFDIGSDGEWDSSFIASPHVVFHGSGDLRMYYHSFDAEKGEYAIGMARSRDGIRWIKLGKILGEGCGGAFDELGVLNPSVCRRKDGEYVMVYEGIDANGGRSIGVAVSSDGLKNWRRLQDRPVLEKSGEDGWDNQEVRMPCLVQMDGDVDEWRLYYRGIGKEGRTGIGLAVSQESELNSLQRWTGFHL